MTQYSISQTHFTGKLREIIALFLPIALMTLSGSLVLFIERLFYSRLSAEAMEAAVNVTYVYYAFQAPCLVLVMMAQVCVGRLQGARQEKAIGSTIWQFIWFSLLSTVIIVPVGMFYGSYYFKATVIEGLALPYLYFLLFINFLYPLGAGLSCFYIGRGKTRLCLFTTLGAYVVNLLLAYALIFGVEGWIPSLGLIGGAISNLVAQGGLCLVLLATFLSSKHAQTYGTHDWHFQPNLFWDCIFPGTLRALNRISVVLCWACIARLMIAKQGDYLLFWSAGSAIILFLPCIGEAVCQALTTVFSNIIGARDFKLLGLVDFTGFLLVATIIALVGIPMLLLPQASWHLLFPDIIIPEESASRLFLGLWLTFCFATLAYVPVSRILAFRDTKFFLITGSSSWIKTYLLMHLAVNTFEIPADQCWIVLSLSNFADLALYLWRINWLSTQKKVLQ